MKMPQRSILAGGNGKPLFVRVNRRQLQSMILLRYESSYAKVAELADAPDLGSGGETREGSSPSFRTKKPVPGSQLCCAQPIQGACAYLQPNEL
jgi:hypothetical protein